MPHDQKHVITSTNHQIGVGSSNNLLGINSDGATIEFKWLLGSSNQLTPVFAQTSLTYGLVSKVMCNYLFASSAGGGLQLKEGPNARMGTGTLVGGVLNISNSTITNLTRFFLTDIGGSITNLGTLYVSSTSNASSFTISSSNPLDASTFNYMLVEGS